MKGNNRAFKNKIKRDKEQTRSYWGGRKTMQIYIDNIL